MMFLLAIAAPLHFHFDATEFAKILDELELGAGPARATPFLPNDFSCVPGMQVRKRALAAALGSKSAAEFRKKDAAFAKPAQAERLAAVFDYFELRLRPWWIATGEPIMKQRLTESSGGFAPPEQKMWAASKEPAREGLLFTISY